MLEFSRRVQEVVGIRLGDKLSLVRLLHEVLVPLLLREADGILLGLEVQVRSLHVVPGGLPTHQLVLPPVALRQDVPVHPPLLALPVARLRGRLGLFVNAHRAGLKFDRGTGEYSGGEGDAWLGAIEKALGHWRESTGVEPRIVS